MVFEILIKSHAFYIRISMVFENNVAVAATALTDRPPFSCHSNFIFINVVKPMVLSTFDAVLGGDLPVHQGRPFIIRENPIV